MHDSTVWQAREINPAKRYLLEYRTLIKRRDALLDELDRLQDANHRATSRLTAVRLGGTGGHASFADGAIRAVDAETSVRVVIDRIDACLEDRLAAIEQLTDERQKLVLTYRYINGWGWEDICAELHYQRTQLWVIHGSALSEINFRRKSEHSEPT